MTIASLLRRKLEQAGVKTSIVRMFGRLAAIQEVTLLYPPPPGREYPVVKATRSEREPDQEALLQILDLAP